MRVVKVTVPRQNNQLEIRSINSLGENYEHRRY